MQENFIKNLNEEEKSDLADKLQAAGYPVSNNGGLDYSFLSFIKDKNLENAKDREVWDSLTNFGYELGDRLLNLSNPNLFGSDIEELQELLSLLGFYSGTHTSLYSKELEEAVEKFQENRGLVVDGNVGLDTVEELKSMQRPGDRSSLNNAINLIGSKEVFLNKQKHIVCFYIPDVEDYKARAYLYKNIDSACINKGITPIFASDINKEVSLNSVIAFVNNIQPSFFVFITESSSNDINYFSGKYSESTMGRVLANNFKNLLNMEVRGSSSEILTKTKPPTVILNLNLSSFGNNYQVIEPDLICQALVETINEIGESLL